MRHHVGTGLAVAGWAFLLYLLFCSVANMVQYP